MENKNCEHEYDEYGLCVLCNRLQTPTEFLEDYDKSYMKILEDNVKDRIVTIEDLPVIKHGYEQAVEDNEDSFIIPLANGKPAEFLTRYAKYLIEYFESVKG